MHAVLIVPGIMGTRLNFTDPQTGDVEEVWPPTPIETKTSYGRIEKLRSEHVTPGALIDNVLCFNFYRALKTQLRQLKIVPLGVEKRLYEFPYDWRCDLFETADLLAAKLDQIEAEGATRITLLSHSMGGLITRLVLEQVDAEKTYRTRNWYQKIDLFAALAVPHLGAPLALARVLGLDNTLGVSAQDFALFASDERWPSGYQLLPAPGEVACWNQADQYLSSMDFYDDRVAVQLGMKPSLVARAKAVHEVLGAGNVPPDIRYFFFAGTGHRTVTRVNVSERGGPVNHGASVVTRTYDAGDGTVPTYSALPQIGQRQLLPTEHAKVFTGTAFRKILFRLLDGDAGAAIESASSNDEPLVVASVSVDQPIYVAGQSIEVVIDFSEPRNMEALSQTELATKVPKLDGSLIVETLLIREDEDTKAIVEKRQSIPVQYEGPAIDRLRVELDTIEVAGHYRIHFSPQSGTDLGRSEDVVFAVADG